MAKRKAKSKSKKTVRSQRMTQERKWKVESAANTLIEAERLKEDSSIFNDAKKEVARRAKAAQKVIKKS